MGGVEARIITLHTPQNYKHDLTAGFTLDNEKADHGIFVAEIDGRNVLPVREHDFFFSSFWVTALLEDKIYSQQKEFFPNIDIPYFYLAQDYEPAFYAWSSNFIEADASYFTKQKIVAIINSKELNDYFFDVLKYRFYDSVYFVPKLNEKLKEYLLKRQNEHGLRKKQILIYGRPGEARNAFESTINIIREWSLMLNKEETAEWQIISLGAKHMNIKVHNGMTILSKGMVSLEKYAEYMLESYAAISLMVSPHPSYPPLEMSTFGVKTITNTFANKDLSGFNDNLFVIMMLSKNYYNSPACLNEMGAAWIKQSAYQSVLLPGFQYSEIKGAVNPRDISFCLSDKENRNYALTELKNRIITHLGVNDNGQSLWERFRDKFVAEIDSIS